jgi:hypothetical protein
VGISVENLADKHYAMMGFDNTGINGLAQRYPGMPRWVKAHVNFKFENALIGASEYAPAQLQPKEIL